MATLLDGVNVECFYHHRKFCLTALLYRDTALCPVVLCVSRLPPPCPFRVLVPQLGKPSFTVMGEVHVAPHSYCLGGQAFSGRALGGGEGNQGAGGRTLRRGEGNQGAGARSRQGQGTPKWALNLKEKDLISVCGGHQTLLCISFLLFLNGNFQAYKERAKLSSPHYQHQHSSAFY